MFQKKISRHKILEKELEWGRLEQGEKEEIAIKNEGANKIKALLKFSNINS